MAEKPDKRISINTFALVSNRGAYPAHPGDCSVLRNCSSATPGQLETRRGFRPVRYGGSIPTLAAGNITSLCVFEHSSDTFVITSDDGGKIVAYQTPS